MEIKRKLREYPVMKRKVYGQIEYLVFPQLEKSGIVTHLVSTRLGGASSGIYSSMNYSYKRGDDSACVDENYRRTAEIFGTDMNAFVCSEQTHTTNVRVVTEADKGKGVTTSKDYTDIDGLITNVPGVILTTIYADCVPLLFVDPVNRAIGCSHAGWRGTVSEMARVTVEKMQQEYSSNPAEILVAIGPSICQDCYEVSADVADAFHELFSKEIYAFVNREEILLDKHNGKYQLDLWKANEAVLLACGIQKKNISVTDICTCCNPEYLFSHRASKGKRGNLGAFIMLKPELN